MKKVKLILLAGVIMSVISCEKNNYEVVIQNLNTPILKSKINSTFLINKENVFDLYGSKLESYYLELKLILANPKCVDKKVYNDYVEKLNLKYTDLYPKINSEEFNEDESHLLNNLLNEVNFNNLKEITLEYETEIIRRDDFSENQKNRLLNFISQFKFGFLFSSFILCKETKNWDGRFDNCVRKQLNSVFADDGNPVPETLYVAGLPESWFGTVATCSWEATFG